MNLTPAQRQTLTWLGIGLAFLSSISLALYMLLIRHSVRHHIPGTSVFLLQLLAVSAVTLPLTLLAGDDWGRWRALDLTGWLVFRHVPDGWAVAGMAVVAACGAASTRPRSRAPAAWSAG